ncbi:MAG: MFS transporter [Planctomycetes bacterium]|nr:MFS transporter [Planctomycetota bacterium]
MGHPLKNRSFLALTITQCLGAFNDNVYRQFILLLAVGIEIPWLAGLDPQSLALACFAAPFVIFALLAGSLADRYSKRTIIVAMKVFEIVAMSLAMLAFALHPWIGGETGFNAAVIASLAVLFIMGTQSALFGPSKYGAIPEIVEESQMTRANGIISMTTNMGIVFGAVVAGGLTEFLREHHLPHYVSGYFLIGIAVLGWIASLFIRKLPPADPQCPLRTNLLTVPGHAVQEAKFIARDRDLLAVILAEGWFFLVSSVALAVFNTYGQSVLGYGDRAGSALIAWTGIGIGVGSLLATWLSRGRLELGLVVWGAIGMSASFLALFWIEDRTAAKIATFIAGGFGGLYIVPVTTFLQERPEANEKGRVLGAAELSTFSFIFLAAGVFAGLDILTKQLSGPLGVEAPRLLAIGLALLMAGGVMALALFAPIFLQRAILAAIGTFAYRIRVHGEENLPLRGGALLVPNHISYVDPFFVAYGSPRVPRFIMHRWFLNVPFVGWFTRRVNVIPISAEDGPRALVRALDLAAEHAREGHLVAIFPEGSITRTGNLLPFSKGLEKIARKAQVPIVPVYLDRVWGSLFSFHRGRFFWKKPSGVPYQASVNYGAPLPPDTPVEVVRQKIQELSADALDRRKGFGETLATRFLRHARRHPRRFCMVDTSKTELSYRRTLISVLALRSILKDRLRDQDRVGVLLPNGNGGALVNIALAVLGKTSVNLNYTAGEDSYRSAIDQCELRTIITSPRFLEKLGMDPDPRHLHVEDLLQEVTTGVKIRATLLALLPGFLLQRLPDVPRDPDQDATIIFSSGSTGMPKGVRLTHHNILSNVRSLEQVFDPIPSDRIVAVLPFFHSFGYTATVWLPFVTGFGAIYHFSPMDAKKIAELTRVYRGTILISTPTFYQSYLRRFEPEDIATVRLSVSGAEQLKSSLLEQWQDKFHQPIFQGYGCTELSPGVSLNLPDVEHGDVRHIAHKPGTIGHPIPGVAVKVVDAESFEDLSVGEEGMLLVRGPNVMAGYLGQPEKTAEVKRDGWYVTGDVAKLDRDGFVTITGRLSRFSKIGGEMVPHLRVEEMIQRVIDERQACSIEAREAGECAEVAVTSVPDTDKGERLVVLVSRVTVPTDEIIEALRDSGLPKLWIPRADSFLEVESLPKLGSGKLDLKAIGELATQRIA